MERSLTAFLYEYPVNGTLDISGYNVTYKEAVEKIRKLVRHDKTFNIFQITVNKGYSVTEDQSEKAEIIRMTLFNGKEEQYKLLNSLNKKIEDIIGSMDPSWSDFEKALYVHDWICINTRYDVHAPNAHELAGVLLDGKAVCQGLTYTFNTIMHRLKIATTEVSGSSHIWSEVCLDGEWYHMDLMQDILYPWPEVRHYFTFLSQQKMFAKTSRDINKYKLSYSHSMAGDQAVHSRYEEHDKNIGLYQKNGWTNEISAFQYYDGYWYNGGYKGGMYDPRTGKYITGKTPACNEVWVYHFNKKTKEFESVKTGLPAGEWKETYRGLFIVQDIAVTRTECEFIGINLKTGKTDTILKTDGTIKDYYTDYTGIIKYRLTEDPAVYEFACR